MQKNEYEVRVNKIKEIRQRLVEVWQSSMHHLGEKMQFLFLVSQCIAEETVS